VIAEFEFVRRNFRLGGFCYLAMGVIFFLSALEKISYNIFQFSSALVLFAIIFWRRKIEESFKKLEHQERKDIMKKYQLGKWSTLPFVIILVSGFVLPLLMKVPIIQAVSFSFGLCFLSIAAVTALYLSRMKPRPVSYD